MNFVINFLKFIGVNQKFYSSIILSIPIEPVVMVLLPFLIWVKCIFCHSLLVWLQVYQFHWDSQITSYDFIDILSFIVFYFFLFCSHLYYFFSSVYLEFHLLFFHNFSRWKLKLFIWDFYFLILTYRALCSSSPQIFLYRVLP